MQVKDPARRFVPGKYLSVTEHGGVIGDRTALPARCGREGSRLWSVRRACSCLRCQRLCKVLPSVGVDFGQRAIPRQRRHRASTIAIDAEATARRNANAPGVPLCSLICCSPPAVPVRDGIAWPVRPEGLCSRSQRQRAVYSAQCPS